MRTFAGLCVFVLLVVAGATLAPGRRGDAPLPLHEVELPRGLELRLHARVPGARSLAVLPSSRTVLVGTRADAVYAVRDLDGDRFADEVVPVARGLGEPAGVAYHDGMLYVAERSRVRRAAFDEASPRRPLAWQVVLGGLPDESFHGTRDLAFGPDGRLYVSLGVPCDVCLPESPHDAILHMNPDGSDVQVFASGVRNSVGLAFHPGTGELFFSDNGADGLGGDSPPDELNRADRPGFHFGYPFFAGGRVRTPEHAGREPPPGVRFPALELAPHSAPLGLHFYRGALLGPGYRGDAFLAEHGSSRRTPPNGQVLARIRFDPAGSPVAREIFARGFAPWGRPVDVAELSDGSLLVSDDRAGALYRIAPTR